MSVAAIKPIRVPLLHQPPQRGDVQACTAVGCTMIGGVAVERSIRCHFRLGSSRLLFTPLREVVAD